MIMLKINQICLGHLHEEMQRSYVLLSLSEFQREFQRDVEWQYIYFPETNTIE